MPQNVEDALKAVTTISDQVTKNFSSAVSQVSSAVNGFLSTSPTSVGESLNSVNKVAGLLGAAGFGGKSSVSQSLNQLGKLGTFTKFKDNFTPPSKLSDLKPSEVKAPEYGGVYAFPRSLTGKHMKFSFKEYERKAPLGQQSKIGGIDIFLPLPANMSEQFSMNYADKQLGIAGFIEGQVGNIVAEGVKGGTKESFEKAGKAVGELLKNDVATKEGLYYGARTVAGLSDSVGSALDKATGAVLNPYQALLFQGVNLRSHSFSYKFSPNNSSDNRALREIIYQFKLRMHPKADKLLFQFPQTCDISFVDTPGDPYFFLTCFLESMTLNYAPGGVPAFFVSDNEGLSPSSPVEIEMSLNFKEIRPVTQNHFEEKYKYGQPPTEFK